MNEQFYFHGVAVNPETDGERDLYASGEDWEIDDAMEHFKADLVGDEYIILVEEIDQDDYPTKEV